MTCLIDKADNLLVLEADSHFENFAGIKSSKIENKKLCLLDIIPPKDRETVMRQICQKDTSYVYFDMYIKNSDNDYVYVHCIGKNVDGTTLCNLTFADVSRSVEKSEKLRREAKQMNHLIDLVNGGVALFKVEQNMHIEPLYLNEACCRFFGTTKDNYSKQIYRLNDLIHPDDRSLVFQAIGNSMATKKPIDVEIRIMTHKNSYIWCKMNSAIQRYDVDNCPIFHAVFTDITRVKEDEEETDRQFDMLVKVFKNMPGPMFITDVNEPFKLAVVSADFMKLIGYTRKEFFEKLGGDFSKLMPQNEVESVSKALKLQAQKGDELKAVYCVKTKSGEQLTLVDRRKIVEGDNGAKSTISILRDVTSSNLDEDFEI
jgi:PAS domain S-box-containing protein